MKEIESLRKSLNKRQTELRRMLESSDQHDEAIALFLSHHAMLHSAKMAQTELWSFEDAILDDMTEEQIRRIPKNREHSVAWCIWHLARIEDVTMNLLVVAVQNTCVLPVAGRIPAFEEPVEVDERALPLAHHAGDLRIRAIPVRESWLIADLRRRWHANVEQIL